MGVNSQFGVESKTCCVMDGPKLETNGPLVLFDPAFAFEQFRAWTNATVREWKAALDRQSICKKLLDDAIYSLDKARKNGQSRSHEWHLTYTLQQLPRRQTIRSFQISIARAIARD